MIHEMKLDPIPFAATKARRKLIEVRLCDEKRQKLQAGDEIVFRNNVNGELLTVHVKAVRKYKSMEELAKHESISMTGGIYSDQADWIQSIYGYYSKGDQSKFGLLAIEIEI